MAEVSLKIKKKDGTFLELDKSYLQSIESLTQLTSDPSSIQYGAIPNSGSATAVDVDGKIKKAIENGTIDNSNLQAEFWMNGNRISSHIITDSDYSPNRVFSVQMSDNISKWDATYAGRNLTDSMTAYALLKEVLKTLPDNYSDNTIDTIILGKTLVYGEENSIGTVADFLKTITITYPYLNSDTYRNTFAKFCSLAQLQCFQDEDGYPVFVGARPVIPKNTSKAIHVQRRVQRSELNYPILLKNKYNGISTSGIIQQDNSSIFDATVSIDGSTNNEKLNVAYNSLESEVDLGISLTYKLDKKNYKLNNDLFRVVLTLNGTKQKITTSTSSQWTGELFKTTDTQPIDTTFNAKDGYSISWGSEIIKSNIISQFSQTLQNDTLNISFHVAMNTALTVLEQNKIYYKFYLNSFNLQLIPSSVIKNDNYQYEKGNNIFNMISNEISAYNSVYKRICKNIESDYQEGISNGAVELFLTNLYYKDGALAKDWSKGQILADGDIVYFDNDTYNDGSQRYWRVTSVKPNYKGEPLFSVELMEVIPVLQGKWTTKTWSGLTDFYGYNVWTFDKNIYYSRTSETGMVRGHYHLTPKSNEWESVVWTNIMRSFTGKYIWHSSSHTYFSEGSNQYVLDNDTHKWGERLWSPDGITLITSLYGNNFWTHNGKTFYSSTYIIEPIEGGDSIREISWISPTSFTGEDVWTDGKNAYFSSGTTHYILNTDTLTATIKKWNGLTSFNGKYIWTDGRKVYYSHGEEQYVLNQDTSTWDVKTWNGLTSFNGDDIWEYMGEIYYSNGTEQYVLT